MDRIMKKGDIQILNKNIIKKYKKINKLLLFLKKISIILNKLFKNKKKISLKRTDFLFNKWEEKDE